MTVVVGSDAALAGQEQAVQATTGIIQHHSTAAALHTQHLSLKLTHRRPVTVLPELGHFGWSRFEGPAPGSN